MSFPSPPWTAQPRCKDIETKYLLVGGIFAFSSAFDAQNQVELTHGRRVKLAAEHFEAVLVFIVRVGCVEVDNVAVDV